MDPISLVTIVAVSGSGSNKDMDPTSLVTTVAVSGRGSNKDIDPTAVTNVRYIYMDFNCLIEVGNILRCLEPI